MFQAQKVNSPAAITHAHPVLAKLMHYKTQIDIALSVQDVIPEDTEKVLKEIAEEENISFIIIQAEGSRIYGVKPRGDGV